MATKRKGKCSKTGGRARRNRVIQVQEQAWNSFGHVIRALPGTPTRETHVLGDVLSSMPQDKRDKLCKTVRHTRVPQKLIEFERTKRSDAIPNQTLELVNQFYFHDDTSRMCPGKRDSVTGKREHKQKRFAIFVTVRIAPGFLP